MSRCPSQAWRRGLDRWQGPAPSHTNCLICELLSPREVWAGGATPAEGWGQSVFTREGVGGSSMSCMAGAGEGGKLM